MAVTVASAHSATLYAASGARTVGLTVPEGALSLIVLVGCSEWDSPSFSTGPKLGGVALTLVRSDSGSTIPGMALYELLDISGRANDDLTFTNTVTVAVAAAWLTADRAVERITSGTATGSGDGNTTTSLTPGDMAAAALVIGGHVGSSAVDTTDISPYTGQTQLSETSADPGLPGSWTFNASYRTGLTTATSLGVTIGSDGGPQGSRTTAVLYAETAVDIDPAAFGAEAGFAAGLSITAGGVELGATAFGVEAGIRTAGLLIASESPWQVLLTGNARGIETPRHTAGGAESNVLTFHANSVPTWEERGLTASEVAALLAPDWYACDSMTVTKGTLDAGTHTDLHASGGTTVAISEVTGTPGIHVELLFSGVDAITNWQVTGYYAGSALHETDIQLWNYDTASWDTVGVMPAESSAHVYSGTIADGAPYFDGSGNAKLRLYHPSPGNTSHDLYLDYVTIGHTTAPTGGLALDDLTDVVAPTPTNGDVLTWNDYADAWLPVTPAPAGDADTLYVDLDVSGAHEVDLADGATHDLTLTGDTTLTLAGASADVSNDLRLILRQDGTGGWTVTWPGSVEWQGGVEPVLQTDPAAVDVIGLVSVDEGTTWLGFHAASAGTPATTVEAETSFGLASAVGGDTEYARQDHTHGTPANPVTGAALEALGAVGPLLVSDDHSTPIVFADLLLTEEGDDLLYGDLGG